MKEEFKEKVYWFDHKPTDDNNGYIYGITWFDDTEEVVHVDWYKTEKERDWYLFAKEMDKFIEEETNERKSNKLCKGVFNR